MLSLHQPRVTRNLQYMLLLGEIRTEQRNTPRRTEFLRFTLERLAIKVRPFETPTPIITLLLNEERSDMLNDPEIDVIYNPVYNILLLLLYRFTHDALAPKRSSL